MNQTAGNPARAAVPPDQSAQRLLAGPPAAVARAAPFSARCRQDPALVMTRDRRASQEYAPS